MTITHRIGMHYLEIKEHQCLISSAKTLYLNFLKNTLNVVCLSSCGKNTSVTYEILFDNPHKMKNCALSILSSTSATLMLNIRRIVPSIQEKSSLFGKPFSAKVSFSFPTQEDVQKFECVASRILDKPPVKALDEVMISLYDSSKEQLIARIHTILSSFNRSIEGNIVRKSLSKQADLRICIPEHLNELQIYGNTSKPFEARCFVDATPIFHLAPNGKNWVTSEQAEKLICGRTKEGLLCLKDALYRNQCDHSREGQPLVFSLDADKRFILNKIEQIVSQDRGPTFQENNEINRLLKRISLPREGEPS